MSHEGNGKKGSIIEIPKPDMSKYKVTAATCVHCRQTFKPGDIKAQVGGLQGIKGSGASLILDEQQRFTLFLQMLVGHSMGTHQAEVFIDFAKGNALATCLLLGNHYTSPDEGLSRYRDEIRYSVRQITQKARVSDDTIEEKVRGLNLSEDDRDNVLRLMVEMRDVLEERGQYPELELTHPADSDSERSKLV